MQWSDLGRGRLEQVKVEVRVSLELVLAIPQRETRMSMDVNWPLLCQSMAGQQDTVGSSVCLEGEDDPWLLPFSNFPFLFLLPSAPF